MKKQFDIIRNVQIQRRIKKSEVFCLTLVALLKVRSNNQVSQDVVEIIHDVIGKYPDAGYNEMEEYDGILEPIIFEIVQWNDKSLSAQFLDTFAIELLKHNPTMSPFIQIGKTYQKFDLTEDAREWFQKELENKNSNLKKSHIENRIASSFFQEGNYRTSCEWLNQAKSSDPSSTDILSELALCHTALMEYNLALEYIRKVREINPDDSEIKSLEAQVLNLSTYTISLPRINSEETRAIFRTGDWLLYSIFKGRKDDEFDLGPVIVQYGKGVEKLLNETILSSIREKIRSDSIFTEPTTGDIRQEFWIGEKKRKIPAIPGTIKTVVGRKKRSVGLGQWKKVITEIQAKKTNPLASEFLGLLMETGISKEDFSRLGDLCFSLSYERNGAAHSTFYDYDDVMAKRKEIVGIINEIISILSK